jgi:hypothetical protein
MHWLLEAAEAVNNNSEDLLRYLHELRRCTQKPNKLVACAFEALSDGPVLTAIAARAICFVEVISIAIFVHKHLAGRHYTRCVNDRIIAILNAAACTGRIPKLAVAAALKEIEPDWTDRIDGFTKAGAARSERVYEAAEKHKHHHLYAMPGYAAMAVVLTKHLDRDCADDQDLKDAFVTSCQLEIFFAVLDDVNRASNFISITENRGQAMAIKSHTFVTPLAYIKLWITTSQELQRIQADAETGGRRKRRLVTHVPRREVKTVKKWIRAHDSRCMVCDLAAGLIGTIRCYGCNVIAHKNCAQGANHNNVLWLPDCSMRWVCNECYFDTHGGGP